MEVTIKWTKRYFLDIPKIDEQHHKLVDLINEFITAKHEGKSLEIFGHILKEIVAYTHYHFETEEKHMQESGYPAFHEHIAQHQILKKQIIKILEELKAGKLNVDDELLKVLKNWLIKHVLDHDFRYGQYYRGDV